VRFQAQKQGKKGERSPLERSERKQQEVNREATLRGSARHAPSTHLASDRMILCHVSSRQHVGPPESRRAGGRERRVGEISEGRLFGRLFGPENLRQELQGVGLELNELETDVEPGWSARRQPLDPHNFRRVCDGRNICKKELHLQELADLELVVAEDTDAAEADVDGLPLTGEKLHSGRATVDRSP